MLRVFAGSQALLAVVGPLLLLLATEAEPAPGFTMQLHRTPRRNRQPERYARRLLVDDDVAELVPLHLGYGTHYTWVYAGTPPQRASVIVDTGSALMAFPCSGCDGCGNHTDLPFDANNSSTLAHVKCSQQSFYQCKGCNLPSDTCAISQSYLEGSSWKASVVEDVVYLGGDSSFDDEVMRNKYGTVYQFGCQNVETGLFVTQVADGIMGLSRTDSHIVAKLHRENKIPSNLFSLCFIEDGGTMSVGQPHTAAHRGEIGYVKMIPDSSTNHLYNLPMKDVRIGGKSINAKAESYTQGHFIVDSGTTDSYLPKSMDAEFSKKFKEVAGRDYQVNASCKGYTNEELALLPTIQLVMEAEGDENEEVILSIPPEQYLLYENGKYCGGIHLTENSGGVIGANLMTNRDVIFDTSNGRVGFVDANCAWQEASNSTTVSSTNNKTTSISEGKEKKKGSTTITVAPGDTSVATGTPAPTANATTQVAGTPAPMTNTTAVAAGTPASMINATSAVAGTPAPMATATSTSITADPATTTEPTIEATPEPVTSEPTVTSAELSQATMETNMSSLHTGSSGTADSEIEALVGEMVESAMTKSKSKEKSFGTHPMVLTLAGAVLVVGFLLMVLISIKRRRQKTRDDQLWSRVKNDEEDDDVNDEEEFGLTRGDTITLQGTPTTKHQRLGQYDNDHDDDDKDHDHERSSNEEDDDVFVLDSIPEEESKVDNSTLERL
uniref:Peptidase A1 domain-containing protein n=1 Tax=Peronospora matthiolae TaxID=2874970 RepID=A0AAV1TD09_9STRA